MDIAELKKIIDRYDTGRRYGGKKYVFNVSVEKTVIKPEASVQDMQVVIVSWKTGMKRYNRIFFSKNKRLFAYCQPFTRKSSIEAEKIFDQIVELAKEYPKFSETKIIKPSRVKLSVGNSAKGWGKTLKVKKEDF